MRVQFVAALMAASVAVPAAAQRPESPEKRLDRIEQQLHAVQRKVFPGGAPQEVIPEIAPTAAAAAPGGVPATAPLADLTARIDALENQLRQLTGQAEENGHRLALTEEALRQLKDTTAARLAAVEQAQAAAQQQAQAAPPPRLPEAVPDEKPVRRAAASAATSRKKSAGADPEWVSAQDAGAEPAAGAAAATAEAAYNEGFHLWEQKKYGEAIRRLDTVARTWPNDRFASWAGNLVGRAYLDDGNPSAAAKALLANYEANPKGERAADSLFFLGQALVALKKPADACKAYDELKDVYGATMRDWLKQRLPAARIAARCS
jgi:TolA-binding protein